MCRVAMVLVPCAAALLLASESAATTWYVPSPECPTIQAGMDSASAGDTVRVACGYYVDVCNIVMKSGVLLTSETGQPGCVTLDAQNIGRIIYCNGVSNTARIEGFTFTWGRGEDGAAVYCQASSPRIRNCRFELNVASLGSSGRGGALACFQGSAPVVDNCVFFNNVAMEYGGAIYCNDSSPTVEDCTFLNNGAGMHGGGIFCESYASPLISGCTFQDNLGGAGGGGLVCEMHSAPVIAGCVFRGHTVYEYGGAVFCHNQSSPTMDHCTFFDNSANVGGGAVLCWNASNPSIRFCTFWDNASPNGSSVFCGNSSAPEIENSILAFGSGGAAVHCNDAGSAPSLSCSDVYGNAGGDWVGCIAAQAGIAGNISYDPVFCDAAHWNFTLDWVSPCVYGLGCGQMGAWGVGCGGPTGVEKTTWSGLKAVYR